MKTWMKFLTVAIALAPAAGFAQTSDVSGFNTTIGAALCQVANAMTGTLGQGLATIAVLFLGIGAFFGKVNWGLAVMVAVGIAAIFGAASIVGVIGATNDGSGGCGAVS